MSKIKFIVVDGPDGVGKSTMLQRICSKFDNVKKIDFPKTIDGETPMKIETPNDFEIAFTIFNYLDPNYVYILDRFMISNIVYDKVFGRPEGKNGTSRWFHNRFRNDFDVLELFFTREFVDEAFEDDLIKADAYTFNDIILTYRSQRGNHYQVIERANGEIHSNETEISKCLDDVIQFIGPKI